MPNPVKSATHSSRSRPGIPVEAGHLFRWKPATLSEHSDAVAYSVSTCCLVVLSTGSFSASILL